MKHKTRGFTLTELIVYIAIFVILITTVTLFAMAFIKTTTKSRIKKEVASGAYSAMKTMVYEIKRANSIYTPTSVFDSHPGQLSLETSQELPEGEQTTYIDFYLDSDRLYLKRESQNPQLLISKNLKVTNLEFEYLASASRITLTLEYDTLASEYQYSYSLSSGGSIRK
jgi:prepilin-type N-terminal cleavage/methylation domain-containing protein